MTNQDTFRKEHELVRNSVAFYDFTLETLEVTGKDAQSFLDYIFVNNVGKMKPGKALYTSMLDEDGIMLDDLILFQREDEKFWITTGDIAQLKNWLNDHIGSKYVSFKDITDEKAIYAIQGPKSKDVVNGLLEDSVDDLKTFDFKDSKVDGVEVMVARAGFTGEQGFEFHFNPKNMDKLASAIKEKGKPYGIEEIESDEVTLASLPVEKGLVTEFTGANTVELGLGWTVNCDKDFIGKEKTCQYKKEGPKRHLLGFTAEDESSIIEVGNEVKLNGETVGEVNASAYGYTVEKNIGFALVDSKAEKGNKVTITTGNGEVNATLQNKIFV